MQGPTRFGCKLDGFGQKLAEFGSIQVVHMRGSRVKFHQVETPPDENRLGIAGFKQELASSSSL